jgi:tRNA-2-methylthio-N6-dimethylallyladenosine synthase
MSDATTPGHPSLPAFRVETWGCQMNVLDGQRMAGQLEALGMRAASDRDSARVVLLNTCAVREKAEAKVYSELGVLARSKQEHPDLVVGVTGCVAQMSGAEILERAPWIDFVAGTGQVERIGDLVTRAREERRQALELALPHEDPVYQFRQISRDSTFQAYVTVIEGCNQYCTFCIVPFTRGKERSRAGTEILEEIGELAARGFREITLLGQTVNAYRDPEEGFGLGELLRRAARISGVRRLRFVTSHPRFLDEDILDALASGAPVAPFLHLPAQSGSDRVLYRMKRRYTAGEYVSIVDGARAAVPGLAVTSDFIVGFPGETEEELRLLSELRFAGVFAFRYSPRPGTASARWGAEQAVPEEVSADRLARLLELQGRIQLETHRALEGSLVEVLLEGTDRFGQPSGRSACNRVVHLEGEAAGEGPGPGDFVTARVTRGLPNSLRAVRVGRELPW